MAGRADVTIRILGDPSGAKKAFAQVENDAGGFGRKMAGVGKAAALGLAGAAAGAGVLAKGFFDAAIESQKITKQTEAVIKSMGGASNVTAAHVSNLSEKLAMQSGVDDELIQSGQNVLLTFGKVQNQLGKGNDIFDRATQSALDMSVALGTDLKAANIQIGKALNDPIKGITALSKAGVSFTEQQKKQITTLAKSGKTLEAQKIILSELDKQFGGSAAAQATAGDKLKVVWGNLQEDLGKKLVPILEKVASWLGDKLPKALEKVGKFFDKLGYYVSIFVNAFKSGDTFGLTGKDGLEGKVAVVGAAVRDAFENWILPAVKKVAGFVKDTLAPALRDFLDWFLSKKELLIGIAVVIGVGLVNAFVGWAISAGLAAIATLAALAPIILIGAAIALLVAGLVWAYQNWGWFRDAVDRVADFFQNVLWPIL